MKRFDFFIVFICFINAIFFPTSAVPYSPWLQRFHPGPLYGGIQLLIADEEFNAELTWNETQYQMEETVNSLRDAQKRLLSYEATIEQRLETLASVQKPSATYKRCYRQHERAIAHFNRELLQKWNSCSETLNAGYELLKNETNEALDFVRNASGAVQHISSSCNVEALKRRSGSDNQESITLCVVARIGALEQRLFDESQFCLDVIASVALNTASIAVEFEGVDNCREFEELKQQFDGVYADISECVGYETIQII